VVRAVSDQPMFNGNGHNPKFRRNLNLNLNHRLYGIAVMAGVAAAKAGAEIAAAVEPLDVVMAAGSMAVAKCVAVEMAVIACAVAAAMAANGARGAMAVV
jgi:hypothetical protein